MQMFLSYIKVLFTNVTYLYKDRITMDGEQI